MSRSRRHTTCLLACCLAAVCAHPAAFADMGSADITTTSTAPFYTAAGIVQAASQTAGILAPNTIATIYGTNLSWTTHAVTNADLNGQALPTSLDGVNVYVGGLLSGLFFVSPSQVNFLIPYEIAE